MPKMMQIHQEHIFLIFFGMLKISRKTGGQKLGYDNEKRKIHNSYKSKLYPKRDGSFQVLKWINDNAYKEDITCEYNNSDTFNISNFSMFEVSDDSRLNPFEEKKGWGESTSIPKWSIKSINCVIYKVKSQ